MRPDRYGRARCIRSREFGQRSALRGGNPFRTKAYARAADNILALSLPLNEIIAQDRLREIPGIGDTIADIVKKLHATGTHSALDKMRKEIPDGVLEMLTIPGRAGTPQSPDEGYHRQSGEASPASLKKKPAAS